VCDAWGYTGGNMLRPEVGFFMLCYPAFGHHWMMGYGNVKEAASAVDVNNAGI